MIVPHDKKLHFVVGFGIAWIVGILCLALKWPVWMAPGAAILAGNAKELWDMAGHGDPDILDFFASAAGGMIAGGMIALIVGAV